MSELLGQLGIDWRLLLSQAVNFFLLLSVLYVFVYKPLIKLLRDRRARIEEGLMKAEEADKRLAAAETEHRARLKKADEEAIGILRKTEIEAKELEAKLVAGVKLKEAAELANVSKLVRAKEEEAQRALETEAVAFVKAAIARTAELAPEKIDDALIARAVDEMKRDNKATA